MKHMHGIESLVGLAYCRKGVRKIGMHIYHT
jgi:hypothetical protein